MQLTVEQAADILRQITSNQWKWLGIKRFVPEAYPGLAERYAAFEKHHAEETGRMIEIIKALCEVVAKPDKNGA